MPELLAPAGDWEAMRAAVANGADAVYFGLNAFNARHRATNFAIEELADVMDYLHGHNVRGYVAFNTLIFSEELPAAVEMLKSIAACGVDAIIVQDLGIVKLARRMAPTLEIHGSTQMTLTEPRGIEFVRNLGVERVVVARELATSEIEKIAAATPMPLEVFIHGALCVSYSGQCLTSESLGGRSANRGQCAQACRLPYELIVDGEKRELGDKAYLLSPQDLAAHDCVADLARIGVSALKIEGRLKSAHYVAAATGAYRDALDAAGRQADFRLSEQRRLELAQSFSRGFSHGFLDGPDHQELVHARFPKSRGVRVGCVVGRTATGVLVAPAGQSIKSGDGVVFDEGHPEQDEQGGRIVSVNSGRSLELVFHRGDVNLNAVSIGSTVWKTDDPEIRRRLEQTFNRDRVARRVPVNVKVEGRIGSSLNIEVRDDRGNVAVVAWSGPLQQAIKHPLTRESLAEQFSRLGDTPFELGAIEFDCAEAVMVPKSVLNDLRRQATQQLLGKRRVSHVVADPDPLPSFRSPVAATSERPTWLYLLVRTMDQLQAAILRRDSLAMVYAEFEDIRLYRKAVEMAKSAGLAIGIATLRILKVGEEGLLRQIVAAQPDAILVRNLGGLQFLREQAPQIPLVADYALNIANEITASLIAEQGVVRLAPSYDLTWPQLKGLLQHFPADRCEVVIHQHMPMFHMEHCVFCHTLSNGKDYRDCGRPCDRHRVDLRDRASVGHPLIADVGCRNTVFNGTAQSAAELIAPMRKIGLCHFRIELLRESADQVGPLLEKYQGVLSGRDDGRATWRQLKVVNQLGVTRGTFE